MLLFKSGKRLENVCSVAADLTVDVLLSSRRIASCNRDSDNFNLIDPSYYWSVLDMRAESFREIAKSFSTLDNLVAKKCWFCETHICWPYRQIDLFTDTAAILNSFVSNSCYGMLRGQIHTNLLPEHPIIATWNNRIQNGRRIGKKVYWNSLYDPQWKLFSCVLCPWHSTRGSCSLYIKI